MGESEMASIELTTIINDTDAETFFAKGGPLSWFSPKKTYALAFRRGNLTDKQVPLIRSVYQQYSLLREVSKRFAATGESSTIATVLYHLLKDKPKVESREDRGRSQRLSRVIRAFHDGSVVHIGHFNQAEFVVGELPVAHKVALWEQIHSSRRVYLSIFHQIHIERET
ncbi:MAG: hypothetical protein FJ280_30680 [Planctomycetes bacterium]|nr:hypothetical protein [Planctomycetota bacterium]